MTIYREMGFDNVSEHPQGAVLYALARTFTFLHKRLTPYYAKYGLDAVKVNALMIIKHIGKDEGIPQRELADRLILSEGNITQMIKWLEKKGLVSRHGTKDRRFKLLQITTKGAKLLDDLWPGHRQLAEALVTLTEQERHTLLRLLAKLRGVTA